MESSFEEGKAIVPYRRITYTAHATERLVERGITKEEVEAAIQFPDRMTRDGPKLVADRFFPNRPMLRVIYLEWVDADGLAARVITVHLIGRRRRR